jgi:hypothetical protein
MKKKKSQKKNRSKMDTFGVKIVVDAHRDLNSDCYPSVCYSFQPTDYGQMEAELHVAFYLKISNLQVSVK